MNDQWNAAPESEWDYGWSEQLEPEPDGWSAVPRVERRPAAGWPANPPAQRLPRADEWSAPPPPGAAPARSADGWSPETADRWSPDPGGRRAAEPAESRPAERAGGWAAEPADRWAPQAAQTRRPPATDIGPVEPDGSPLGARADRRPAESTNLPAHGEPSPWDKTGPAWGEAPPRNSTPSLRGGAAFPRGDAPARDGAVPRGSAPRSDAAPWNGPASTSGIGSTSGIASNGLASTGGIGSTSGIASNDTASTDGSASRNGAGQRGAARWQPGPSASAATVDNVATTPKRAGRSETARSVPSAAVTEVIPVTKAPIPAETRPTGTRPPQAPIQAPIQAPPTPVPTAADAPTQTLPAQAPLTETSPAQLPVPAIQPDPGTEPMTRSRQRALARAKDRQRRRRALVAGILLAAVALIGVDLLEGPHIIGGPARHPGKHSAAGKPTASASTVGVPSSGPGTFAYATGTGPVVGTAGTVRKYRVAVENGTGQSAATLAAFTQQTLADPRGWIKGGNVRFQRVGEKDTAQFTVYLATPATSEKMCAQGGIHTQQLISCRVPGQVIINLALWVNAVPGYGAPVATYQQFTLNHEIGRELGHGNETCPAPGALAPVMQEQSLGLDGCVANAWPYVNGVRYSGPVMP